MAKNVTKWPKMVTKWSQNGHKMVKIGQKCHKMAKNGQKMVKNGHIIVKNGEKCHKMAKDGQKRSKMTIFYDYEFIPAEGESQCGNIKIFLSLKILREIDFIDSRITKTAKSASLGSVNFVHLVNFSLQKVQQFIKIKIQSL